jgi:hypothetical protein
MYMYFYDEWWCTDKLWPFFTFSISYPDQISLLYGSSSDILYLSYIKSVEYVKI